jgi:hypothetical protein
MCESMGSELQSPDHPGKRPLHEPAPPTQSTLVRGATHREPRHDVPRPQSAPNRRRVVAAIPEHTVRPLPRSPPFAVQRGNRIDQRQGFLQFTGWGAVIGKYPDGTPAIVEGTFGSGWVILTGVHPGGPRGLAARNDFHYASQRRQRLRGDAHKRRTHSSIAIALLSLSVIVTKVHSRRDDSDSI